MIDMTKFREIIAEGSAFYGSPLSDSALDSLGRYFEILCEWNETINLVSANDLSRFVEYHILDSLKAASVFDFISVRTCMDFGSGAGLPGVPLAAAFPAMKVTLVDSRLKRCKFLNAIAEEIPMLNLEIVRSRVEDLPEPYFKHFDCIVSRAAAKLDDLYNGSLPYLHDGGTILAIKGDSIDDELSALESLNKKKLFNISSTAPSTFSGVRRGTIVKISDSTVINTSQHT